MPLRRSGVAAAFTTGVAEAVSGLLFPENLGGPSDSSSIRFKFTGAALLDPFPATYIWLYEPRQQTGYYTTFFHGPDGPFTGDGYYGAHPYPQGGSTGTAHNWEISIEGNDFIVDDNGNDTTVVKDGTFYPQSLTVEPTAGNELILRFRWDLRDPTKIMTRTTVNDTALGFPPSDPALTWGDAPWQPSVERGCGVHRGIQIYASVLDAAQIQARRVLTSSAQVIASNPGSLWYVNMNPTPDDISDKSGLGHHPAWHNANRPTLWEP